MTISDGFKRDAIRVKLNYRERARIINAIPTAWLSRVVSIVIRLDKRAAQKEQRKEITGNVSVEAVGGRVWWVE